MDQSFLVRLLVCIGVIWLTQFLTTDVFTLEDKPKKLVIIVVALLAVVWLAFGSLPALK